MLRVNGYVRCLVAVLGSYVFCVLLNYLYLDAEGWALLAMQMYGLSFASILRLCGVKSKVPLNVGDFVEDDIRRHANNLPDEVLSKWGPVSETR